MKKLLIILAPLLLTGCLSGFSHQAEVDTFVGWHKADLLSDWSWGQPDATESTGSGKEVWHYDDGFLIPMSGVSSGVPVVPLQVAEACRHSFSLEGDKIVKASTTCDK